MLEYDPLSESAYRQLMRVLARADQSSAAQITYTCPASCAVLGNLGHTQIDKEELDE